MNISVPIANTMEFIVNTEISPLISKGYCKVCYVGQDPNRNHTVITKEVATEMGRKLPGSPVVGYFNKEDGDFEGHNREIIIDKGKFEIVDVTRPYGFVPTDASVWFEKFDDNGVEHEYLCCDIYVWTGAYPESQRIIDTGNNQSMELTKDTGFWTNDDKTNARIFIYNEALINKLCVLGENVEPCFEGAQVGSNFSLESSPEFQEFKTTMFSMITELQETLSKGGDSRVFTEYAVEIGCALWDSIYALIEEKFPNTECEWKCSIYRVEGIYEEGSQKFAILKHRTDNGLYRMDFSIAENDTINVSEDLIEVTQSFVPAKAQYELSDIEEYEAKRYAKKEEPEEKPTDDPEGDEPDDDDDDPEEPEKKKYNLEEVTEYVELKAQFDELNSKFELLQNEKATLDSEVAGLREFKLAAERQNKQSMIDRFYMLSDDDKKDVIEHIDTYSLDDIEAKLSILCVRNKVNFNLDPQGEQQQNPQGLFNLNGAVDTDNAPDWVKAIRETAKKQ